MKGRRRQVFVDGSKSLLPLMEVMRKLVYGVHLRSELFDVLANVVVVKTTTVMKKALPAAVAASGVEGCLAEAL